MESVIFTGLSGRSYHYFVWTFEEGRGWLPYPGNYCFARVSGVVTPIYFGETENLYTRPMPPAHERWAEAIRDYGVTHLLSHLTMAPEPTRKAEEKDLIAAYNPPMNVQHRTGIAGASQPAGALGLAQAARHGIR